MHSLILIEGFSKKVFGLDSSSEIFKQLPLWILFSFLLG
jgi:hypothetical protein